MFVSAIIPAAGSGRRFGSEIKKQFIEIDDKPVLYYTIRQFEACSRINEIIIVVPDDWIEMVKRDVVEKYHLKRVTQVVVGGDERFESVHNGLKAVNPKTSLAAIHDGVRPIVSTGAIERVVAAGAETKAAILGVPVKDTIKAVSDHLIDKTLDRSQLWAIQTPQVFDYDLIMKAYAQKNQIKVPITDDAMLVEALGHPVKIVQGEYTNIKITSPEDYDYAAFLLRQTATL